MRRGLRRLVARRARRRCCTSILAIAAGCAVGGAVGGDRRPAEGDDRRQRGDLDDHAQLDRGLRRPRTCSGSAARCRAATRRSSRSRSPTTSLESARLPVFWGDPELQGLHIGIFIALFATILFWVLLNRSVTGYEVRAVGFNPDAAEYGGISAGRNYVKVMLICGVLAGLAGALDVLGWQFRIATNDIQISQVGFFGIAVALLGRNTAVGTVIAALLFGALLNGTSVRNLDPTIFEPRARDEPHLHHPGPDRAVRVGAGAGHDALARALPAQAEADAQARGHERRRRRSAATRPRHRRRRRRRRPGSRLRARLARVSREAWMGWARRRARRDRVLHHAAAAPRPVARPVAGDRAGRRSALGVDRDPRGREARRLGRDRRLRGRRVRRLRRGQVGRRRTSSASSSGRRCWPPRCATRRR